MVRLHSSRQRIRCVFTFTLSGTNENEKSPKESSEESGADVYVNSPFNPLLLIFTGLGPHTNPKAAWQVASKGSVNFFGRFTARVLSRLEHLMLIVNGIFDKPFY